MSERGKKKTTATKKTKKRKKESLLNSGVSVIHQWW